MQTPYLVYLVDDETNLLGLLQSYLESAGFRVRAFSSGADVLPVLDEPEQPHIWILDIMLPDIDGYELLRLIRSKSDVPIIFISARDQDIDKIIGLELGSDDYLAKPFLPRELVIRVQKLLQRTYEKGPVLAAAQPQAYQDWVAVGPYLISEKGRLVKEGDNLIELTTKEFELIIYLLHNQGLALNREQILTAIWGEDYIGSDRAVDDLVKRIRKKMPKFPLETVYGFGYRLTRP
ncbi:MULTISPECIES: response regulator transcription factor [Bacillales]|jgi:two-component system response regulator CssR|uniref:DNA-binding response regulator n=1 Tax=Brevibacillus aydinogluensis TaxID=927786 RepID=A0AA48MCB0_9BACL|nr:MULTISPECIES: response regulator transcription factor [Bacillales]REK66903.1 MAG: DNA-binding response regulator [Brevibacillus sp.]MBR8658885.1 response regulator transcription factor [Brevibacillus sp. NL20B1]MDT3416363.1 two-component system response regulator CssR [Brevibacillus aydinogluensis]NNV02391.1 response regulator transcription factor [Brevibacillus sp. MCWH]UFJ62684.1 response regulator transcription factor [Anoxybacillus sediminis]